MIHRPALELAVPRFEQPDDVTCGPTCLLQVLRFYGDQVPFDRLLALTSQNPDGGTLAVYLALTARQLGYATRIHSFNLRVFDPTWAALEPPALAAKLRARAKATSDAKVWAACRAHADLIDTGGQVALVELTPDLMIDILERGHPVLCGLNATYLYRQARERPNDNEEDDVAGEPVGHFLVVCGHRDGGAHFTVRDPAKHVPYSKDGTYDVEAPRLINAIHLGIVSFDAVLLELWPEARG
ncbi:MAG: cysteine peptidase family C39 domain-containing protein [Planctomycetota bacterium]